MSASPRMPVAPTAARCVVPRRASRTCLSLAWAIGMLSAGALQAHHHFAPEYERDLRGTIEGVVVSVAYANPHVSVLVAVSDDAGRPVVWYANTVSPASLEPRGWRADTIAAGDRVVVEGFLGRDGARRLWIQSLTRNDGLVLYPVGRER